MFGRKIVYGIKGTGVEIRKLGKPTKEVTLHTKKIIEHTYVDSKGRPAGPKIKEIHDRNFKSNLSKNVYVKPKNFIDFEGGIIKNTNRKWSRPKSFMDFNGNI